MGRKYEFVAAKCPIEVPSREIFKACEEKSHTLFMISVMFQ